MHPPSEAMGASLDDPSDLDFMDELLSGKDWSELTGCSSFFNVDGSSSPFSLFNPAQSPLVSVHADFNYIPSEFPGKENELDAERIDFPLEPSIQVQEEEEGIIGNSTHHGHNYFAEHAVLTSNNETSNFRSLLIDPLADGKIVPSIKERLTYALMYIKDSLKEGGVLVQIWVPIQKGGQYVLTTCGQPFWLDHNYQRLVNYRTVSTNYQFPAQKNSTEALGLPGRVFVGKVPEWTPDVRFFRSHEYPRVNYAQQYDVRGSLAVPVFERGSHSCSGVLEIVRIEEKVDYDMDLENICIALQAVDLKSSDVTSINHTQERNDSYRTVLPEISEVLRVVCQKHKLPLAQTWIPCIQQGKQGTRHSDENYQHCVSTVDTACYVNDASVLGFHKACSEYHLLIGQGLVGHAFTTNQPCFSSDITSLSKTRYPLSHHARIFSLRGAVAIRLRCVHTGTTDFVLEFFLPVDCIDYEMQRVMLNSLSTTIQEVCRTLRVVTEKELVDDNTFLIGNTILQEGLQDNEVLGEGPRSVGQETPVAEPDRRHAFDSLQVSLITSKVIEVQNKGKELFVSREHLNFEECDMSDSGFVQWNDKRMSVEDLLSDFTNNQESLSDTINFNVVSCEPGSKKKKKVPKRRRGKAEKVISMQVLQQHFAGSLKDAAKSLGVCPTTLKRICRVHGITRWPSRKIKKVGNSLQKIQKVIDSVEGVGGSSQINSLYSKLSAVSGPDFVVQGAVDNHGLPNAIPNHELEPTNGEDCFTNTHSAELSHPSSSFSHSCNSSRSSNGSKQQLITTEFAVENDSDAIKDVDIVSKRMPISMESHHLTGDLQCAQAKCTTDKFLVQQSDYAENLLRVKAVFGEDMVRLRLQPFWGLQDLKMEIAKRFDIVNVNLVVLKYLDDDNEWVLLTCDADLHECIDIHKDSSLYTIKISVRCQEPTRT